MRLGRRTHKNPPPFTGSKVRQVIPASSVSDAFNFDAHLPQSFLASVVYNNTDSITSPHNHTKYIEEK
jgi:hypothetical protein